MAWSHDRDAVPGDTPGIGRVKLAYWLLMVVYFVALSVTGGGIGWYGAKYYRAKTSICKPCEARATEPGMGISNP